MQGVPGNEPGNLCSGCDGDISRLVEQITDLERIETESLEGIANMEFSIKEVEAELSKETKIYMFNYAKNSEELTDNLSLGFVTQGPYSRNAGSRTY